eukprot:scaffold2623_cov250-Pinguiococcus_pyrenoidosus.AAC.3
MESLLKIEFRVRLSVLDWTDLAFPRLWTDTTPVCRLYPQVQRERAAPPGRQRKAAMSKVSPRRDGFHLVSDAPAVWRDLSPSLGFQDVTLKFADADGVARVAIDRQHVRNAFRPITVAELRRAIDICQDDVNIGVIVLTGEGSEAFCSGGTASISLAVWYSGLSGHLASQRMAEACIVGDQALRGEGGYDDGSEEVPRLRVLDLQVQMRRCPKPIIAAVAGYAVGGGHILHMVCDLTIAADNAVFGQTGPRVGSFDAGYGSSHMARIVGQKKAREIWFLCNFYSAQEALDMGLVNTVGELLPMDGFDPLHASNSVVYNAPGYSAARGLGENHDEVGEAHHAEFPNGARLPQSGAERR